MGPGDQVWEKFGHNAIWIHDEKTGTDLAYNYGMFDFAQPNAELPLIANHPYFQTVTLKRDLDVALAGKLAGVKIEDFRALNPSAPIAAAIAGKQRCP